MQKESADRSLIRAAGGGLLTVATVVVVGSGFLALALLGLLLAVWLWQWISSVLDAPGLVRAVLTFLAWLVATTVLPAIQVTLMTILVDCNA